MKHIFLPLALILASTHTKAEQCELILPPNNEGPEFGLIVIPGEGSEGEAYRSAFNCCFEFLCELVARFHHVDFKYFPNICDPINHFSLHGIQTIPEELKM